MFGRANTNSDSKYVDHKREDQICHCYPACKEVFYKASLSSSILSKFYAKNHVEILPQGYGTVEDVADNLVVIDILFSTTQETEITELVSYGWGNFLGDVGGVLGLFLGASAFTLIEFVFFIATLAWNALVGVFRCGRSL
ncbi:acid-sensing ion channel 4-A-like [Bolinopsis microptera]|uniref:acid-sensing ion channel 4-A-like n=1 Tax=Bolinopsis microptera TaxID=2820187 RepID=UPI0030794662